MKELVDGERPRRPPKRRILGLSGVFWEIAQPSLAYEAKAVGTFIGFLEKATPDAAILKKTLDDVSFHLFLPALRLALVQIPCDIPDSEITPSRELLDS